VTAAGQATYADEAGRLVTVTGSQVTSAVLCTARGCYGAALLVAPGLMIRLGTRRPDTAAGRRVARVLGGRHLVQAALTAGLCLSGVTGRPAGDWARPAGDSGHQAGDSGRGPGLAGLLAAGAAVDLVHAASMIGLAAVDRHARRAALTDAALETALAAGGMRAARS
jgi:hypothetical protein